MFVFMTVMASLLPVFLIVFGVIFLKKPPKTINCLYGFRTTRSMKNQESWDFAHKLCGKIFLIMGVVTLPLSIAFMFIFNDNFYLTCVILLIAQCVSLFVPIFVVEKALKRNFPFKKN